MNIGDDKPTVRVSPSSNSIKKHRPLWHRFFLGSGCLLLLAMLFLPPLLEGFRLRKSDHGRSCRNKMKLLAVALQNYHDQYKRFPPAYTVDGDGKPLHSWRVLILPFLEQTVAFRDLDLRQPWNSPHNWAVLEKVDPSDFCCSAGEGDPSETNYLAVIGDDTIWPGRQGTAMKEILDGTSHTIMLVEVADSGIHWAEPRDMPVRVALQGINPPHVVFAISSGHPGGAMVAFADDLVQFLPNATTPDVLGALLTRAGAEKLDHDDQGNYLVVPAP
jgi:hypothetical protein